MAIYQYQALDKQGSKHSGLIEADTAVQARQKVRDLTLLPIDVSLQLEDKLSTASLRAHFKRIKLTELTLLTRQLASLLDAGVPLTEALATVAKQSAQDSVKKLLLSVRESVREGLALSQALQQHTRVFPKLYVAAVRAGENSGHLDVILVQLAEYLEQQRAIKLKVQQALIYPAVICLVCFSIVVFLLTYVVPSMVKVFASMHQTLPLMTRVLIAMSTGFKNNIYVISLVVLAAIMLARKLYQTERVKKKIDQIKLRLPLIKRLVILLNVGHFIRTLGMLLSAGVPLVEALRIAIDLLESHTLKAAFTNACESVREGESLRASLSKARYVPPMTLQLIASGESSGRLPEMLARAAADQAGEFNRFIEIALTLFEPLMILTMGAIVLFIVLAVLLPIFSMNHMIQF